MKQSNKGFDYSYNAQAVVDSAEQIIVAAEVTNQANDKQQAVPMAKAALDNLEAAGIELPKSADGSRAAIPNTADAGYFSEKVVGVLEAMGIDPYIAIGREKDNKLPVAAEAAAPSAKEDAERKESAKEKMRAKLQTATGKAFYAAQAHRRACLWPDQVGAGDSRVSVAGCGESNRRVAIDLFDSQSAEDMGQEISWFSIFRGIVRAEVWALADAAEAQWAAEAKGRL